MSTLSEQFAREDEARKANKKTKAKRDEHGRFVKEDADLSTPSF